MNSGRPTRWNPMFDATSRLDFRDWWIQGFGAPGVARRPVMKRFPIQSVFAVTEYDNPVPVRRTFHLPVSGMSTCTIRPAIDIGARC